MFDGEVSGTWCAFVEGLVGSQSVLGVAEQVDFDGEGVAVADGGAVEMFVLQRAEEPLALNAIAHNFVRWVARVGLQEIVVMTKTMRRRYFALPDRITTSARKLTLHLPTRWPWAERFLAALDALRCVSYPLRT